ncbi:hypothetical protein ABK040_016104 [Willaertia magna]
MLENINNNSLTINLEEEESEFFSNFFDKINFDRSKLQSTNNNNINTSEVVILEESIDDHIEQPTPSNSTDEDYESLFGLSNLYYPNEAKSTRRKSIIKAETGTEFLKLFTADVLSQKSFLEGDVDIQLVKIPSSLKLLCKFLLYMESFSIGQHDHVLTILKILTKHLFCNKFNEKYLSKDRKCYYSVKYTLLIILRYCIFIIKNITLNNLENIESIKVVEKSIKLMNQILTAKKTNESEISKENVPSKVIQFDFELKLNESNDKVKTKKEEEEKDDLINSVIDFFNQQETNVEMIPSITSTQEKNSLSFERLIRHIRSYAVASLNIGEVITNYLQILLNQLDVDSKYENISDELNNLISCSILILSKQHVGIFDNDISSLFSLFLNVFNKNKQEEYTFSEEFIYGLTKIILKVFYDEQVQKKLVNYCMVSILPNILQPNYALQNTSLISSSLYIMDNLLKESGVFSDMKQDLRTKSTLPYLISSPTLEELYPIKHDQFKATPKVQITLKGKNLEEYSINELEELVFSSTTMKDLVECTQKIVNNISTEGNVFLNNYITLILHLLTGKKTNLKQITEQALLEQKSFEIFTNISKQITGIQMKEMFGKCIQLLSTTNLNDTFYSNFKVISSNGDSFKFLMNLVFRNAKANRNIFLQILQNFLNEIQTTENNFIEFERILFLAFCFEALNPEGKKTIFNDFTKLITKEGFASSLKDQKKLLLTHVIIFYEYLCAVYSAMPQEVLSKVKSYLLSNKEVPKVWKKNLLLEKEGIEDAKCVELDYKATDLSKEASEILQKEGIIEDLVVQLIEGISTISDLSNKSHSDDYFLDVALRLMLKLFKVETLNFSKGKTASYKVAELLYKTHKGLEEKNLDDLWKIVAEGAKEISSSNNLFIKTMYVNIARDILEQYAEKKSLSKKFLLEGMEVFTITLSEMMKEIDKVILEELRVENELTKEYCDIALDLLHSSLAKENVITSIHSLITKTPKLASINVAEWSTSKTEKINKTKEGEDAIRKYLYPVVLRSVHLSTINLSIYSVYQTLTPMIQLFNKVINKVKGQKISEELPNSVNSNPTIIEVLLQIRESHLLKEKDSTENMLSVLCTDGFLDEMNLYKAYSIVKVLSNISGELVKETKISQVVKNCLLLIEEFILAKDVKKLNSVKTLFFGEPKAPKYCQYKLDAKDIFTKLLSNTNENSEIDNAVFSFLEIFVRRVDSNGAETLSILNRTPNLNEFIDSKLRNDKTRKSFEGFLLALVEKKEIPETLIKTLVLSLLDVLKQLAKSNSKDFGTFFGTTTNISLKTKQVDLLIETINLILVEQIEKKERDFEVVEIICSFITHVLSKEEKVRERTEIVKEMVEDLVKDHGLNLKPDVEFTSPIILSNSELELIADQSTPVKHKLVSDKNKYADADYELIKEIFKTTKPIDASTLSSDVEIASVEKLFGNMLKLLKAISLTFEENKKHTEKHNTTWDLKEDSNIEISTTPFVEEKSTFAAGSFNIKLNLERRQEKNILQRKPMPRHLIAANLSNIVVVSEQANLCICRTTSSFGDFIHTNPTRSEVKILSNHSMPFKPVHLKFNPENDNYLVVAGIFECHILVVDDEGNVTQQIPLYLACEEMPQETYVIDVEWIPGEQCLLSVTTNQFVKVYDLSSDTFCPTFNFAAPGDQVISSVFASDPNGGKDLKTCFALTKKGTLYYQTYFNSGGERMFSDIIDLSLYNTANAEGKCVFYSELLKTLFVSFADGTFVALQVEHLSGKVQSVLTISKKNEIKALNNFSHLCEIVDKCGCLAFVTQSNQLVIMNFQEDLRVQVLPAFTTTVEGITCLRPYGKNSAILCALATGEIKKYVVRDEMKPCLPLPPKSRINKILKKGKQEKKSKLTTAKKVEESNNDSSYENEKVDVSKSSDITTKCTYSGSILDLFTNDVLQNRLKEDNSEYIEGNQINKLSLEITRPEDFVITHIQILLGKHSKDNISKRITSLGQEVETEDLKEQWYTITFTNSEVMDMGSKLEVVFSETHPENTCPQIDCIKIFGVTATSFLFQYNLKRLKAPSKVQEQAKIPVVDLFPSKEANTCHIINQMFAKYLILNDSNSEVKAPLMSVVADELCNHQLSDLKESILSVLLYLSSDKEAFILSKSKLELDKLAEIKLAELDPTQTDYLLNKFLGIMLHSAEETYSSTIAKDKDFISKFLKILAKNKEDDNLNHEILVKVCSGLCALDFIKGNDSSFENIQKLLLDDEEAVRIATAEYIANIFYSSNYLPAEKVESFILRLVYETFSNISDSLTLINFLELLLALVLKYCSLLSDEQRNNKVTELVDTLLNNFMIFDCVSGIANQTSESERKLIILTFFTSLLAVKANEEVLIHSIISVNENNTESCEWAKSLVSILTSRIENLKFNESVVSSCFDASALLAPNPNEEFMDIMGGLLKSKKELPLRLFSPLFSDTYLEENKTNLFTNYSRMVLQVLMKFTQLRKKNTYSIIEWEKKELDDWNDFLSNLTLNQSFDFVKSLAKYYLLQFNQSEENYFKIVDQKLFLNQLEDLINPSDQVSHWSSERARRIVVRVNEILDNAVARPNNWIQFCSLNPKVLTNLLEFTFLLDESVIIPLELMNSSLQTSDTNILEQITKQYLSLNSKTLDKFVEMFVINGETINIRKEASLFISKLAKHSNDKLHDKIVRIVSSKLSSLPFYGKKGKEFTKYLLVPIFNSSKEKRQEIHDKLVNCLTSQNNLIDNHPNSYIYESLQHYFGCANESEYYLETVPCLVCTNPELPFQTIQMNDIVKGKKFSHSSQYSKFKHSYTIESLDIKITEPKKSKMIRTIEIYYNNNSSLSASDLTKSTTVWQKGGCLTVPKYSTSAKLDFSVPITCCNLLIEFSSFYYDLTALDVYYCVNCNIAVYDRHGVCTSCGENAFGCTKCKAINYDNVDAFLCNTCGHCKYAQFDFKLSAKQVFSSDKIRNEEDCKKSLTIIDNQLNTSESKLEGIKQKGSEIKTLLMQLKTGDNKNKNVSETLSQLEDLYYTQTKSLHQGLSTCQKVLLTTRKKLRDYISINRQTDKKYYNENTEDISQRVHENKCFGCSNNFISQLIDFYLEEIEEVKGINWSEKAITEFFKNIHRGVPEIRMKAQTLLTKLALSNQDVSDKVNLFLKQNVLKYCKKIIKGYDVTNNLLSSISLLKYISSDMNDPFFNSRIVMLFEVLVEASKIGSKSVVICEEIIHPILHIISEFTTVANTPKGKQEEQVQDISPHIQTRSLQFSFQQVRDKEMTYEMFKQGTIPKKLPKSEFDLLGKELLVDLLLNTCSGSLREEMTKILFSLCKNNEQKEIGVLQALTTILPEAIQGGEYSSNFFLLFKELVAKEDRKILLSKKGFLTFLCKLLRKEVTSIYSSENSYTAQSQDLTVGASLLFLSSLLTDFLKIPEIMVDFKSKEKHISVVLSSFLSLKSLVVQKTKATSESCALLEQLTEKIQETDSDKRLFIAACVETLKTFSDNRTALFVFERLNHIIQPVKEEPIYRVKLIRSHTQEFYFQGRLSKPVWTTKELSKNNATPIMSDVVNKICDEMSIHSDIPFELLVDNRIIALNLPITKVYEKVWRTRNNENQQTNDPMEIVFRLQGLDGEATEDRVDSLPSDDENIDIVSRSKITSIISKYDGINVIVSYLRAITDFSSDKELAKNLLQFMLYCTNVKVNRRKFLLTDTIECLLSKCKYVFQSIELAEIAELLLLVSKALVKEATKMSHEMPSSPLSPISPITLDVFNFVGSGGDSSEMSPTVLGKSQQYNISKEEILEQLKMFLDRLQLVSEKIVSAVQSILPYLTYGKEEVMDYLVQFFQPYLNFQTFDVNNSKQKFYLDSFVNVVSNIPNDISGSNLKSHILRKGITKDAINFILNNYDLKANATTWKDALQLPALPFVLNLLQGLVSFHAPTLNVINDETLLKILHKIEENTQEKMVATLAESLLNTISDASPVTRSEIENLRKSTKEKKKKKALSKREKTLKEMKLSTTLKPTISFGFDDVEDEKGITCSVCGDGYTFKPTEVIGTYVFCKHVILNDNSSAYSTVSQFNTIHTSCHSIAVQADANRNPPKTEWEGAYIRNSFIKCNALFPFRGPKTTDTNYTTAVTKYWNDIKKMKRISKDHFDLLSHDLMLLFDKFAKEESFSKDAGGGSSIHQSKFIPFVIQMGLYILDEELKNRDVYEAILSSFLATDVDTNLDIENVYYNTVLSLFLMTLEEWDHHKNIMLKRIISTIKTMIGENQNIFNVLRPSLIFVTLIDEYQRALKTPSGKKVSQNSNTISHKSNEKWIKDLNERLKNIDNDLLDSFEQLANIYNTKILKYTTIQEFLEHIKVKMDI